MPHTAPATPPSRPVAFQRWRNVLLLHAPLRSRIDLPRELELDRFDGEAFISIVAWEVRDASPSWAPPIPGLSRFRELIVRTFVRAGGHRGFWNLSWDVSNVLVAGAGRMAGHPFSWARIELGTGVCRCERRWPAAGEVFDVTFASAQQPALPSERLRWLLGPQSLFLQRGSKLVRSPVVHSPWELRDARLLTARGSLADRWGVSVAHTAHVSPGGVDANVLRPERVPSSGD